MAKNIPFKLILEKAKDYLTRWYDIEMDDEVRELLLQLVIEKMGKGEQT